MRRLWVYAPAPTIKEAIDAASEIPAFAISFAGVGTNFVTASAVICSIWAIFCFAAIVSAFVEVETHPEKQMTIAKIPEIDIQ